MDSGSADTTADLWLADGEYAYPLSGEEVVLAGRRALVDMVNGDFHQAIITGGAGHLLTSPSIRLDGDSAVATCYSVLIRRSAATGQFEVDRLSANRWMLRRTPDGWRVQKRTNRLLDGAADARDLLRSDD